MSSPQRFVALDVFCGIAIAAMILVNTPGSWNHIYAPLAHSDWHGCPPIDLIIPFFLFITGSAMVFAFRKHEFRLSTEALLFIGRCMALLFLIGLFLNWFGFRSVFAGLRVMGVLQRIGLAQVQSAILVLGCSRRQHYPISVALRNFVLAGLSMAALAWLWNQWLPINKSLWTGSYVLFTSASCLLLLVLLIWLVDVLRWNWFAKPLQVYSLNPLFVYALSWIFARLTAVTLVVPDGVGGTVSAYESSYMQLAQFLSPLNASLLFALLHVHLFWLVSLYLYRRNIVIKI